METYIFIREESFYLLELADDADARANAALNPGTKRVEKALTREVVWDEDDLRNRGASEGGE